MNYHESHWRSKFYPTQGKKPVSPRISLIVCVVYVGSDGSVLYSLTQVNTDKNVFCLFLTHLVKRLAEHDKNFRENSVIMLE